MRSNVIDTSKGSTLFSISRKGDSPLRLCFAVGRRVVVMKWRHAEEWISLTTDTVEGFQVEAEFHLHEAPNLITILGSNLDKNSPLTPEESVIDCSGIFTSHHSSSSNSSPTSPSETIQLLVGSRHQFELVKVQVGTGIFDSVKIATIPSAETVGAIAATEVRRKENTVGNF